MFKKILIANDHFIVRLGIFTVFEFRYNDIEIYVAENYFQAEKIISEKDIDLLIMDVQMTGVKRSVIQTLKMINHEMKILLFSEHTGTVIHDYIDEGADGFLNKKSTYAEMICSIENLYNTGNLISSVFTDDTNLNSGRKGVQKILSKREFEICMLLIKGKGNLDITNILSLKQGTVSTYKKRIFTKLQVNNLVELINVTKEINDIGNKNRVFSIGAFNNDF